MSYNMVCLDLLTTVHYCNLNVISGHKGLTDSLKSRRLLVPHLLI